jgi:signal transduction histidine kinase
MTMPDLSMHILDIVENSTRAGARNVAIEIVEDTPRNLMTITIADDGKGMTPEELRNALDPFYTSKSERKKRVGLGLPLMQRTAEQCGGTLDVVSEPGKGTRVLATMQLDHIDRPPLGDFTETIGIIVTGSPNVDFDVKYVVDGDEELFSTRDDVADESSASGPASASQAAGR